MTLTVQHLPPAVLLPAPAVDLLGRPDLVAGRGVHPGAEAEAAAAVGAGGERAPAAGTVNLKNIVCVFVFFFYKGNVVASTIKVS